MYDGRLGGWNNDMNEFNSNQTPDLSQQESAAPQAIPASTLSVASVSFDETTRQLVLVKRGQKYVFRCDQGDESTLLNQVVDLVQRGETELDWFDAALISHELGRRMCRNLSDMVRRAG